MDYELIRHTMQELERLGAFASAGYNALAGLLPSVTAPSADITVTLDGKPIARAVGHATKPKAAPRPAAASVQARKASPRKPGYRRVAPLAIGEPATPANGTKPRLSADRILETVSDLKGGTASEVATKLGVSVSLAYYHLDKLLKAKRLTIGADKKYRRLVVDVAVN